jgi:uncharacterized protein (DUF1499 family)
MRAIVTPKPVSVAALWCRRLAIFALAVGAIAVAATRFQIVEVPAGLTILASAILIDCIALLLGGTSFVTMWRTGRRGVAITLTGLLIAAVLLAWPAWLAFQALRLPVLNDVSTDTRDPPAFSQSRAALAARDGFVHGSMTAAEGAAQRAAYPGVQPILLELDADEAYQLALKAVIARGWKIVDQAAPGAGRSGLGHIDAIQRSLIMGFPEDVTIRVKPLAGQTRIDVRSASRFGRNDFGASAQRIEKYAQELQNQLDTK